jgi:hypothetical protein
MRFKIGDKVRPKKEYVGKESECGGTIQRSWAGVIDYLNEDENRICLSSGWNADADEFELDGPSQSQSKVVKMQYHPGMPIERFVKKLLRVEKDKDRLKALRTFSQCVLPKHVKNTVDEALTVVLRQDVWKRWGMDDHFEKGVTNAILIYGASGTGKTMLCESIAAVVGKNLMRISSAELQSNVPGETERNIQKAFKQAKENNAILMFDECDSVLSDRNMVGVILGAEINALLTEIERFDGIVLLTTNRLHRLDAALQRRIVAKVELPPPEFEARVQIWRNLLPPRMPVAADVKVEMLAKMELTGGEIKNAILLAARKAIARNEKKVKMSHFDEALVSVGHAKESFEECRPQRQFCFDDVIRK